MTTRPVLALVCYLVAPGERYMACALNFALSYRRHPAGMDHDLLLVVKEDGIAPPSGPWTDQARRVMSVSHPNEGYDIRSLQWVAQSHDHYEYLMWFGSSARILADDWLLKFWRAMQVENVGAATATGSYERGISQLPRNPHLRPSALMIRPLVFNGLNHGPALSRLDHYEFEHGLSSFYRRLGMNGMTGVVVGANGRVYEESEWPESGIYRTGDQPNLLIADGQTDNYMAADPPEREALTRMAWPV